ncbi:beta-lactamase family protein [Algoriphagus aestuariicola]|uniref:Beta-lactamase family protein n=1 Tax=Algoriphagus aestuariicola TaxID=1852016 RepID=A0ABS3BL22_9BACT|nr:serine hydrolase domain-containing protein [Algoriphagus aestuariicola]MBN7800007.1 beta-lactamase family protein [Algoriphagus aestuariicola]
MKSLFLTFGLICLTVYPDISQNQSVGESIGRIIEENGIPGISYTYLDSGRIKEDFALGVGSKAEESINRETVFSAASLSKPVFAYLVMQLVDEGLIDLDSSLSRYYDYMDIQKEPYYPLVTARMVLSHTSGLPNWRTKELQFKYKPGERFNYSGEGYVWLQRVVEHLKEKPLEDLAQEYVFKPLEMKRSSYIFLDEFEENHSLSFKKNGEQQAKNRIQSGNAAASLQTTSHNFGLFLEALLSGKLIGSQLRDRMFFPQVPVDYREGKPQELYWGLGIGIQQTSEGKQIFQWGDNYTFRGYFTANTETGDAVVYLTNSEKGLKPVRELVALAMPDPQPACDWMDYD